jgi:hypothetical protein
MVRYGMGRVVCFHLMVSFFLSLSPCTVPLRPAPSYLVLHHLHSLRTILYYTQLLCPSPSNPTLSCPVRYYPSLLPVLSTSAQHHALQSHTPSSNRIEDMMVMVMVMMMDRETGVRKELRVGDRSGVMI